MARRLISFIVIVAISWPFLIRGQAGQHRPVVRSAGGLLLAQGGAGARPPASGPTPRRYPRPSQETRPSSPRTSRQSSVSPSEWRQFTRGFGKQGEEGFRAERTLDRVIDAVVVEEPSVNGWFERSLAKLDAKTRQKIRDWFQKEFKKDPKKVLEQVREEDKSFSLPEDTAIRLSSNKDFIMIKIDLGGGRQVVVGIRPDGRLDIGPVVETGSNLSPLQEVAEGAKPNTVSPRIRESLKQLRDNLDDAYRTYDYREGGREGKITAVATVYANYWNRELAEYFRSQNIEVRFNILHQTKAGREIEIIDTKTGKNLQLRDYIDNGFSLEKK